MKPDEPGRFPQARIALWAEVVKNARIKVDQPVCFWISIR